MLAFLFTHSVWHVATVSVGVKLCIIRIHYSVCAGAGTVPLPSFIWYWMRPVNDLRGWDHSLELPYCWLGDWKDVQSVKAFTTYPKRFSSGTSEGRKRGETGYPGTSGKWPL